MIAPLGAQGDGAEVYLDYAGAALPVASQDRAASLHADALAALTAKYDALAAKVEDKKGSDFFSG